MKRERVVYSPERVTDWIAPSFTALVVIDVQRDFCLPGRRKDAVVRDYEAIAKAVDNIERLLHCARQCGVQVVLVKLITHEFSDSPAMKRWKRRTGWDDSSLALCRGDTEGAEYYRITRQPGDIEVTKQRYSAFVGTNLDLILRGLGLDTLVVTGVTTECCVESTVRDAFMRDYNVFVVDDACASYAPSFHEASLRSMALNFACILDTETVLNSWKRGATVNGKGFSSVK